jgi:predicted ATPase
MAIITIKNVGPIKNIESLKLNRVNVFMGPQSSGKSTIAKIISYCTWVEKDVAITQSLDEYNVNGSFRKRLEEFHRINGYFKDNTEIFYESDIIKLQFKNNKCSIEWVDKYAYKRSKIEYISSERSLIILPFIQKVEMPNNNNRSFLFDWYTIRSQYNKENRVKILGLPVEYYYDENTGESHIISTDENNKYDILLENASSGLQSLTP